MTRFNRAKSTRPDIADSADSAPAPASGPLPSAGVWRRFVGASYEGIVLFAVVVFFGYAFSALVQYRGEDGPLRWAFQGFLFTVVGVYFVWFWSNGRRSLPMKTVSLQLVTGAQDPVSPARALSRFLIAWLLMLLPLWGAWMLTRWLAPLALVPFLWGLADRERRALYDVLAGTRLAVKDVPPR